MSELDLDAIRNRWAPGNDDRVHLRPDEIKSDVRTLIAEVERLRDALLRNALTGPALRELAAEAHAALDRYHVTGEMGEFIAAQKRYNDEEMRLRRALHDLTGKHYQPTSGRHC
ncbi:MAG: hypothetical protein M1522_06775 [Actinobacteria bacterium]|nr:hypothetical protein [Actinomycetota bacterium]